METDDHSLSLDDLERRLCQPGFPFKRDHYRTTPREFFARLCQEEVATWKKTEECPDTRYAFAPSRGRLDITSCHFHIDPLADLYTEHTRISSHVKGWSSTLNVWRDYVQGSLPRQELLHLALSLQQSGTRRYVPITDAPSFYLREAIFMLSRECTQFKSTLSKAVLQLSAQLLGTETEQLCFLDPCMGWGDRLAGALATQVKVFVGNDPNPLLRSSYQAMIHDFCGAETRTHLIQKAFEDIRSEDFLLHARDGFDVIFTSPPFSSFERYFTGASAERLQSSSRYAEHAWGSKWLLPAAEKMVRLLRPGGCLMLYLSDTKVGLYCQQLVQFLSRASSPAVHFHGVVWCCRNDRARPLWIWQRLDENSTKVVRSLSSVSALSSRECNGDDEGDDFDDSRVSD